MAWYGLLYIAASVYMLACLRDLSWLYNAMHPYTNDYNNNILLLHRPNTYTSAYVCTCLHYSSPMVI